jgi:GNAT superfamily N-acetyltransferase
MDVLYRAAAQRDYPVVAELIRRLYQEDPAENAVSDADIERTFSELAAHPDKGTVLVIERSGQIIGYALLINFWSNEHGGNVLTVDELYVVQEFRRQGVATDFLCYLIAHRFNQAVALQLEVTPSNSARRLYEKLGFAPDKNTTLLLKLR